MTGRTEKWARAGTKCWRIWFTASGECDSTAASSELAAASAARSGCAGGIEAVQQPEGPEEAQWSAPVPFPANVCALEHLPLHELHALGRSETAVYDRGYGTSHVLRLLAEHGTLLNRHRAPFCWRLCSKELLQGCCAVADTEASVAHQYLPW